MLSFFLVNQSKTNQYGKLQHVGCLRNKDVQICPVGAVGLYLFQRFHVALEAFPDFTTSEAWFTKNLIPGKGKNGEISYETHAKAYASAFQALGIVFDKSTHINREQGAKYLDRHNVSDSQTKRHGLWNADTCEAVYLHRLALEAMKVLSGHLKQAPYFVARSHKKPPQALRDLIFPDAEHWLQRVNSGVECQQSLAAVGFLQLLIMMKDVILQDACFLMDIIDSKVWQHPIFRSEEFLQFKQEMRESLENTEELAENRLRTAIPELASHVIDSNRASLQKLDDVQESLEQRLETRSDQIKTAAEKSLWIGLSNIPSVKLTL